MKTKIGSIGIILTSVGTMLTTLTDGFQTSDLAVIKIQALLALGALTALGIGHKIQRLLEKLGGK